MTHSADQSLRPTLKPWLPGLIRILAWYTLSFFWTSWLSVPQPLNPPRIKRSGSAAQAKPAAAYRIRLAIFFMFYDAFQDVALLQHGEVLRTIGFWNSKVQGADRRCQCRLCAGLVHALAI